VKSSSRRSGSSRSPTGSSRAASASIVAMKSTARQSGSSRNRDGGVAGTPRGGLEPTGTTVRSGGVRSELDPPEEPTSPMHTLSLGMGLVSDGDSTVGADVLNDLLDESSARGGSDPPGTDGDSTFNFETINEALDDVIDGKISNAMLPISTKVKSLDERVTDVEDLVNMVTSRARDFAQETDDNFGQLRADILSALGKLTRLNTELKKLSVTDENLLRITDFHQSKIMMLKKHLDMHTKARETIIKKGNNFKEMVAKKMSGESYHEEDESSDENFGNDGEEIENSLSHVCVELSRVTDESDSFCGSNIGAIVEKDMLNDDDANAKYSVLNFRNDVYWKLIENLQTEFRKTQDMFNFTVESLAKAHLQFLDAPEDLEEEFKPVVSPCATKRSLSK